MESSEFVKNIYYYLEKNINRKLVIWGTGGGAHLTVSYLGHFFNKVEYFVDNSSFNEKFWGLEVKNPNYLLSDKNKPFILVASDYYEEIFIQLDRLGYKFEEDYICSINLKSKTVFLEQMMLNKIIFNEDFRENSTLKINYLDVGARGGVQEPWNLFDNINIIGFEPDEKEVQELNSTFQNQVFLPYGLWSSDTYKTFYLYKDESTSSLYKPNIENNQYVEKHWVNRLVKSKIQIECKTIDQLLEKNIPDFIKIDAHGSEYEILKGAEGILKKNIPLVLVETWNAEIYKDAPLTHDIMKIMYDYGYQVFDLGIAAAWHHRNLNNINMKCKQKIIGLDLLFVKRMEMIDEKHITEAQLLKFIALLELYGFRDYGICILEASKIINTETKKSLLTKLINNNESENIRIYPKLH